MLEKKVGARTTDPIGWKIKDNNKAPYKVE